MNKASVDSSKKRLLNENRQLRDSVASLSAEIVTLKQKIDFLTGHATLLAGIKGETLISGILKGKMTALTASEDVILKDGKLVEVKYSRLNNPHRAATTKRWSWSRLFGNGGQKRYDYVVLVGEKDERWSDQYRDPLSPFVIFSVPFESVLDLTVSTDAGRFRAIQLTTNPTKARNSNASALFRDFERTRKELARELGI